MSKIQNTVWSIYKEAIKICLIGVIVFGVVFSTTAKANDTFKVAVLHGTFENKRHSDEFDSALRTLGIPSDKYGCTTNEMNTFIAKISDYDMVFFTPLFNFTKDGKNETIDMSIMKGYAPKFKEYIKKGGAVIITDGNYANVVDWLTYVDPGLGLIIIPDGLLAEGEPKPDSSLLFPNDLKKTNKFSMYWSHYLLPKNSKWDVLVSKYKEGEELEGERACLVVWRYEKGYVFVTNGRPQNAAPIENWRANLEFQRLGIDVTQYSESAKISVGQNIAEVSLKNHSKTPVKGKLEVVVSKLPEFVNVCAENTWDIVLNNGNQEIFEKAVEIGGKKEAAFSIPYNVTLRGEAEVKFRFVTENGTATFFSRLVTLPELFTVTPPRYRGVLSQFRRGDTVGIGINVYPTKEDISDLVVNLAIFTPEGEKVSSYRGGAIFGETMVHIPFAKDLPPGNYAVKASLTKGYYGKALAEANTTVKVLEYVEGQTVIDEDLTFIVDGKPFFPLGIYHIPTTDYEAAAGLGFNLVQAWPWDVNGGSVEVALTNGLKVLFEGAADPAGFFNNWYPRIGKHPSLMMWYCIDEPSDTSMPNAIKANEAFRELDPNHHTYMVSNSPMRYKEHRQLADVVAPDVYPYWQGATNFFTKIYRDRPLDHISTYIDKAIKASENTRPIVFVPQALGHEPNSVLKAMSFLAVTHEARGIIWYAWKELGGPGTGVGLYPEQQPMMKETCSEIKTLVPALLNVGRSQFKVGEAESDVHGLFCKAPDGPNYVIMVNPWNKEATFTVNDDYLKTATVLKNSFGEGQIPVGNRSFTTTLPPYGVATYEWTPQTVAAKTAELSDRSFSIEAAFYVGNTNRCVEMFDEVKKTAKIINGKFTIPVVETVAGKTELDSSSSLVVFVKYRGKTLAVSSERSPSPIYVTIDMLESLYENDFTVKGDNFEIVKTRYGANGSVVDVTKIIADYVKDGKLEAPTTRNIYKHSVWAVPKLTLAVFYRDLSDNTIKVKMELEDKNTFLTLP